MTTEMRATSIRDEVAVVMVVRDEPAGRLQRVVDGLATQRGVAPFDVAIAVPAADEAVVRDLCPWGAVRRVISVGNESGQRCPGLNAAVRAVSAEVVVRVDARSIVCPEHVARCVDRLATSRSVGVVGGAQRPQALDQGVRPRGVARALRNPWLLGNAAYRRPGTEGLTDTVYLGAFRRAELLELGGYDEHLDANEDFDLCARYRDAGRQVWLEGDLVVGYEPRSALRDVARQYHAFGVAKVRFWRRTGRRPSSRQVIALGGAAAAGVVFAASLRRPARLALVLAAGVGMLALLDHAADPRERDPRVRAHAWTTNAVVVGSWVAGVASELVRSGDVEHALQRDAGPLRRVGVDDDLVDDLAPHE
jgi:hypothetical protein